MTGTSKTTSTHDDPGESLAEPSRKRIPFAIEPETDESPRGYPCRVAHDYRYPGPGSIVELAGLNGPAALEDEKSAPNIDFALRLDAGKWAALSYMRVGGQAGFQKRRFYGQIIDADRLNYGRPRVCPRCLAERPVWLGLWDLKIVCACPIHRCMLIDRCPCSGCRNYLTWSRPGPHLCRCGYDLRRTRSIEASAGIIAIAKVIRSAGGFGSIEVTDDCARLRFPQELPALSLNVLLELILLLGSLRVSRVLKQTSLMLTSLSEAKTLCRRAALILQDWPAQLNELLETMQARSSGAGSLSLKRTFGLLYPYWLNSRNSVELGFFSRAFENWIQEHWTGLVRGQNTALSSNMRAQPRWIPAPEGAKQANLVVRQIRELIQRGEIKGILISPSGTGRRECWIDRQSLADWIARRDRALSTCMNAKNVGFALGLSSLTLKTIAAAGVIREVQAWEKWFAGDGPYYERSDVEAIQKAFAGQNGDASGPSEAKNLITLQHAVRLYLGRQRLPLIIEAVKSGQLIPTGKAEGSARLGGYLFVKAEIAAYSPPRRVSAIPDDLMDCGHAAEILQTNSEVVRNLARNRKFFSPPVLLHGRKLIRKAEVERFSLAFVALAQVARQCATSSRAMVSGMARRGVKILAVRLPGKGLKLFIPRTAAEFIGRLEPISGARGSGKRAQ